jgi:hypothetical protein
LTYTYIVAGLEIPWSMAPPGFGTKSSCTPKLEWYNLNWLDNFKTHVFSIIDYLGTTHYAIEIHPGNFDRGKNNIKVLSDAIKNLHEKYHQKYNQKVLIFIENRTGQHIKDGEDIKDFWEYFKEHYPNLTDKTGIILDIQQFHTVNKGDFKKEFSKIPKDCLIGVHIHKGRHQVPAEDDKIPWKYVSEQINELGTKNRPLHILHEVDHAKHAEKTYEFCKSYLGF